MYRGAGKSLARPGRKRARKHVRDARDFNNIETRAVVKFLFLLGNAPKEIYAILTETLACFLPGRAKDLSASLYNKKCFKKKFQRKSKHTVDIQELFFPPKIVPFHEIKWKNTIEVKGHR